MVVSRGLSSLGPNRFRKHLKPTCVQGMAEPELQSGLTKTTSAFLKAPRKASAKKRAATQTVKSFDRHLLEFDILTTTLSSWLNKKKASLMRSDE